MEAFNKTLQQFFDLYKSMSPSQRGTLIVVPLIIVGAFAFLMFGDRSSSYVPLSWGKTFTSGELSRAKQTLMDAGLDDYRRKGLRLMVPKNEIDRYNAALVDGGALPTHWTEDLEISLANSGMLDTPGKIRMKMKIVLGRELRRMLRVLPDIEDASLIWAPPTRRRWPNKSAKVKATLAVLPRRGRELSLSRIQSLRYAVAGMVPDLESDNVTVLNQASGAAYTVESEDSHNLQKARDLEREYEQKIRSNLAYIPGVLVTVNVDLENIQHSTERKRTVDNKPVSVMQKDSSRTTSSSQRPARAEPGAGPNVARTLQPAQNGTQRSQQSTDTDTESISLPTVIVIEKTFTPLMPKSVQAAISIPKAYAHTVALENKQVAQAEAQPQAGQQPAEPTVTQAEIAAAEMEIKATVQAQVAKLIPKTSPPEAIDVSFHVPGVADVAFIEESLVDSVSQMAGRWGGAIGLALFALWVLWMLNKSMSRLPSEDETLKPELLLQSRDDEEEPEEEEPPELTRRDELQSAVRDNPEAAAAVLGKWLRDTN